MMMIHVTWRDPGRDFRRRG